MYEPFISVTVPLSSTVDKVVNVNLQRILLVEPVGGRDIPFRKPMLGYLDNARSILWLNVAGENIAVRETRDEIAEAAIEVARRIAGTGGAVPTMPAGPSGLDLSDKRGRI